MKKGTDGGVSHVEQSDLSSAVGGKVDRGEETVVSWEGDRVGSSGGVQLDDVRVGSRGQDFDSGRDNTGTGNVDLRDGQGEGSSGGRSRQGSLDLGNIGLGDVDGSVYASLMS